MFYLALFTTGLAKSKSCVVYSLSLSLSLSLSFSLLSPSTSPLPHTLKHTPTHTPTETFPHSPSISPSISTFFSSYFFIPFLTIRSFLSLYLSLPPLPFLFLSGFLFTSSLLSTTLSLSLFPLYLSAVLPSSLSIPVPRLSLPCPSLHLFTMALNGIVYGKVYESVHRKRYAKTIVKPIFIFWYCC